MATPKGSVQEKRNDQRCSHPEQSCPDPYNDISPLRSGQEEQHRPSSIEAIEDHRATERCDGIRFPGWSLDRLRLSSRHGKPLQQGDVEMGDAAAHHVLRREDQPRVAEHTVEPGGWGFSSSHHLELEATRPRQQRAPDQLVKNDDHRHQGAEAPSDGCDVPALAASCK